MCCKKHLKVFLTIALLTFTFTTAIVSGAEVWHGWVAGGEMEAMDALLQEAGKLYPEHTFMDRGFGSGEMRRQLGASFIAGNPPEIIQASPGYDLKQYVNADRLRDLDDVWLAIDGDNVFTEELQRLVRFDDHIYAIPLNTHVTNHVFYNKEIFDRYDLETPETWEEFIDLCHILKANGIEPIVSYTGQWTSYHLYAAFLTKLGAEGWWELGRGNISFNDPRIRAAYELYTEAFLESYMFGWAGYHWADATNKMIRGEAAMCLAGDWIVAYLHQNGWTEQEFDFFPAPGTQNMVCIQVDCLAAIRAEADQDVPGAMAFLTAAGRPEGQVAFNSFKGSVAANLTTQSEFYDPIMEKTYKRIQDVVGSGGHTIPNLISLFPPEMYQEMIRQMEMYAMDPTEAALNRMLDVLEGVRQELLSADEFINWE